MVDREQHNTKERKVSAVSIILLIIALLVIIGGGLYTLKLRTNYLKQVSPAPPESTVSSGLVIDNRVQSGDKQAEANPLSGRQIYFAGIEDCVVGPATVVYLENLEENLDFYMVYEIYNGEDLIFSTDLIPSGDYIEWIPSEYLEPGVYTLAMKEIPYYQNVKGEFIAMTSPINQVTITVAK